MCGYKASIDAVEASVGVEENKDVEIAVIEDLKDDLCDASFAQLNLDSDGYINISRTHFRRA